MTKEDKELLLKDLCARLPYGVKIHINSPIEEQNSMELFDVNLDNEHIGVGNEKWVFRAIPIIDDEDKAKVIKPYLRPMPSMTEDEAKEIAILHGIKNILSVKVTSDYIDVIINDGVCSTYRRTIWFDEIVSSVKCFDFLNAHHFDYRGLIERGLALEAPEGMYK